MRILYVTESLDSGGRECFAVNILRNIDRKKYNIDFFVISEEEQMYTKEVKALGAKVFSSNTGLVNSGIKNFLKKNFKLAQICKKNKYDVVHIYGDTHLDYLKSIVVSLCSDSKLIMHAHGATPLKSSFKRASGYFFRMIGEKKICFNIACSYTAGKYMYTARSEWSVLHNPFDISKFLFDAVNRKEIRDKYGISNTDFLIGHIGRFSSEKNHEFILMVFRKMINSKKNVKLLLVGDGLEAEEIKQKVREWKLAEQVIFVGVTNEIYKYYSAFDIFWFPSIKESYGMCAVEAQAAGIPVIISKGVPTEIIINENVAQCDLKEEEWIKMTLRAKRCDVKEEMFAPFKISEIVNSISKLYDKASYGEMSK